MGLHRNGQKDFEIIAFDYCTDQGRFKVVRYLCDCELGFDPDKTFYTDLTGNTLIPAAVGGADPSSLGTQIECPSSSSIISSSKICANIEGSCFQIEKREAIDPNTLASSDTQYLWFDGTSISETVEETCCNCDCECGKILSIVQPAVERCLSYGNIGGFSQISKLVNGDVSVFSDEFFRYESDSIDLGTFTVQVTRDGITQPAAGIYNSTSSGSYNELQNFLNANDPFGGQWVSDTFNEEYIAVRDDEYENIILTPTGGGADIVYPLTNVDNANFSCDNYYPVTMYSKIIGSDDGGATWTTLKNWGISSVWATDTDINFRDDGFGLGASDIIDEINIYAVPRGLQFFSRASNRWAVEYEAGRNSTDDIIRVLIAFDYAIDADCPTPNDYTKEWYEEAYIMSSQGDTIVGTLAGAVPTWGNTFDLENATIDASMESCTIL